MQGNGFTETEDHYAEGIGAYEKSTIRASILPSSIRLSLLERVTRWRMFVSFVNWILKTVHRFSLWSITVILMRVGKDSIRFAFTW